MITRRLHDYWSARVHEWGPWVLHDKRNILILHNHRRIWVLQYYMTTGVHKYMITKIFLDYWSAWVYEWGPGVLLEEYMNTTQSQVHEYYNTTAVQEYRIAWLLEYSLTTRVHEYMSGAQEYNYRNSWLLNNIRCMSITILQWYRTTELHDY